MNDKKFFEKKTPLWFKQRLKRFKERELKVFGYKHPKPHDPVPQPDATSQPA